MRKTIALLSLLCLALAVFVFISHAHQGNKPSPPANASLDLGGGKSITIDYSSPRMRGRKIFGGLVPYGQVWRAGANESTTFVTTADISVGGTAVPAGSYTLFAIPEQDKWTLIISKKTGEWGTQYPGPSNDLARIPMKVSSLPSPVENFTISFDKSSTGGTLNMDWETTRASVQITKK
ncbi:MAG TPA: DUF2911 domain-containing protein [Candidatus Sulfotelmatobacter sp.]|nr:DUF2911 domain-containing protein [Candidatus Sulfotelmatobacter sp.]